MAIIIDSHLETKFNNKKIDEIKTEADVPITEAFELYLRNHFFSIKQNYATEKVLSYWKDLFDKNLKKKLVDLDNNIENQSKFNHIVAELINNLNFEDANDEKMDDKKENSKQDTSPDKNSDENEPTEVEDESQQNENEFNALDTSIDSLNENENLDQSESKEVRGDPSKQKRGKKNLFKDKYKVYTNEYDEIKEASELENEDEIVRLRKNLDQQLTNLQNIVGKSRLQTQSRKFNLNT